MSAMSQTATLGYVLEIECFGMDKGSGEPGGLKQNEV
jgi:hypothetical protein